MFTIDTKRADVVPVTDPAILEAINEALVAEVREAARRWIRRYRGQLPPPPPESETPAPPRP